MKKLETINHEELQVVLITNFRREWYLDVRFLKEEEQYLPFNKSIRASFALWILDLTIGLILKLGGGDFEGDNEEKLETINMRFRLSRGKQAIFTFHKKYQSLVCIAMILNLTR